MTRETDGSISPINPYSRYREGRRKAAVNYFASAEQESFDIIGTIHRDGSRTHRNITTDYLTKQLAELQSSGEVTIEGSLKLRYTPNIGANRHILLAPEMFNIFAQLQSVEGLVNDNLPQPANRNEEEGNQNISGVYKYLRDKYFNKE